jgi:hypothetical protein
MHDLGGFALLLIGLLLAAIVLFQFILPALLTWTLGILAFLVTAFLLTRSGRVHPVHLDSYLKPGLAWALLAAAVGAPVLHGIYLFANDAPAWWPWILGINTALPLALTIRLLVRHFSQKRRYIREGHDIEDLLESLRARIAMIEVKEGLLSLAASLHEEPEPWERLAGVPEENFETRRQDHRQIEGLLVEMRTDLVEMATRLEAALSEVRDGTTPAPHPAVAEVQARLETALPMFDQGSAQAQTLIAEVLPGTLKPIA